MKVDLLPHNQEAYEKIREAIADGKKKIAVSHATGSGKSYLISKLCEDYSDDRKLVLVPSKYIKEEIQKLFVKYGIKNIDVVLYQKLINMDDQDIAVMDYSIIILDEYHHDTAKVWDVKVRALIDTHPDSLIFGTSATPVRSDGVNTIDELFEGNCVSDMPLSACIAKKIVPLPMYVGALYTLDDELEVLRKKIEKATNSKEEKKEYYKKINAMRSQIEKSYGMPIILNKHIRDKEGSKYIVFCKNKKHLEKIMETVIGWFQTAGCKNINSYVVHSSYEKKDAEYNAFCEDTSHNLKLLFCVDMLNEGLHLKNISGVLLLRPTKSSIVWHQQIGRTIEANNTKSPVVIDAVNNFSSVGKGMELMEEIREAVKREKESNPNFDDRDFLDIETFFVLEQVKEIQELFAEIEGRLHIYWDWSEEENDILREYYPSEGANVVGRLRGKTKSAVKTQARRLGLSFIVNIWTEEENNILREYYPSEGTDVIKRLNGRTRAAIQTQARKLGLNAVMDWTKEELVLLDMYFPEIGAMEIVKRKLIPNHSYNSLKAMAYKRGLRYRNQRKNYTSNQKDDEVLIKNYKQLGKKVMELLPHMTENQIKHRANQLGLKFDNKKLTEEEKQILLQKYNKLSIEELMQLFPNRSKQSIISFASKLGITSDRSVHWSKEEDNKLYFLYPEHGSKMFDQLPGKSRTQIIKRLSKLNIKKSNPFEIKMELVKCALSEGVVISKKNQYYKGVNLYEWRGYNRKNFTEEQWEIINQVIPPNKKISIKVIDIETSNTMVYPSKNSTAYALKKQFHIIQGDTSIKDAIQRRLSGEVTTPYKGRFVFEYADDESGDDKAN